MFLSSGLFLRGELAEDPQDIFANWALKTLHLNPEGSVHLGILFILFGLIKYLIAGAVWFASWDMRRYLIGLLCLITLYGAWSSIFAFSAFNIVTLWADIGILIYLWKFLPKHLQHHQKDPSEF